MEVVGIKKRKKCGDRIPLNLKYLITRREYSKCWSSSLFTEHMLALILMIIYAHVIPGSGLRMLRPSKAKWTSMQTLKSSFLVSSAYENEISSDVCVIGGGHAGCEAAAAAARTGSISL